MNGRIEGIRGDDLVEHLDFLVLLEELFAAVLVPEVLDQVVDVLIIEVAGLSAQGMAGTLFSHLRLEKLLQKAQCL